MKYWTSGDIPPPSQGDYVYVERPCDQDVWDEVVAPECGKISVLYGSRQSGKSSLLVRIKERATDLFKVVRVDIDAMYITDSARYTTELSILDELLSMIAEKAGRYDSWLEWSDRLSRANAFAARNVNDRFHKFMREVLTPSDRVLLLFDEFDRFLRFGPLWHFLLKCFDEHVRSPAAEQVRIVIAGLVRPTDLLMDRDNSKWTMFTFHWIGDFNGADRNVLRSLARGLRNPPGLKEERVAAAVVHAAGGHPYLTMTLLAQIAATGTWEDAEVENVIARYISRNLRATANRTGEADSHFNFAATYLLRSGDLALPALSVYERLRNGDLSFHIDTETETILRGAGLVSLEAGVIKVKSRIVGEVFDEHWIAAERTRILDKQAGLKSYPSRSPGRNRVMIINIGGTLGLDYGPDDKTLDPTTPDRFLIDIPEIYDLVDPFVERVVSRPLDGANITPPHWKLLADKIDSFRDSGIAGVVVMTGTDTMAYTASAVAFALGKTLKFPVAFVGAQARRKRLFADASPNLLRALIVAAEGSKLAQVVIVFNDQVFRAVRADKKDDFRYDGFWAPTEGPLAVFVEEIRYQVAPDSLVPHGDAGIEPRIDFEDRILTISQRPGLRPDLYLSLLDPDKVKGVLIESLGVGNLPTIDECYGFEILIKTAISKAIPVLIASRYPVQPELAAYYAPATGFLKLAPQGVISASDMVPPAATVKFMWAIAEIRRRYEKREVDDATRLRALGDLMSTNLVGEIRRKDKDPPTRGSR